MARVEENAGYKNDTSENSLSPRHQHFSLDERRPHMANRRPDYEVFTSRKGSDDKTYYTRLGAAWNVSNDGISIKLDALPVSGELVMFPPKNDD